MFWAEDTFFSYLQIAFPCCLKEKTSRAMMHSCSTYLVSEILSVWCDPYALSNRWWVCVTQMGSSVSQLLCSRPYTENSLSLHPWNFISGCSTWDDCNAAVGQTSSGALPLLQKKKMVSGTHHVNWGWLWAHPLPPKMQNETGSHLWGYKNVAFAMVLCCIQYPGSCQLEHLKWL